LLYGIEMMKIYLTVWWICCWL